MIGDFGVPIAIFVMIGIDISISDAYTQVGVACNDVLLNIIYDFFFNSPWVVFFKTISHTISILFRNWLCQKESR